MAEIQKHGQKVAGQYMALENESLRLDPESKAWHIMPKLHMFQRICDSATSLQTIGATKMKQQEV